MPANHHIDNVLNVIYFDRNAIALQQFAQVSIYFKNRDKFFSKVTHWIIC